MLSGAADNLTKLLVIQSTGDPGSLPAHGQGWVQVKSNRSHFEAQPICSHETVCAGQGLAWVVPQPGRHHTPGSEAFNSGVQLWPVVPCTTRSEPMRSA